MDVFRQALSVLLVFTLLGGLLWTLRRSGRITLLGFGNGLARKSASGNRRSMAVMERLALTPTHTLHMVSIDGKHVLVATHPQGCTVVDGAQSSLGAHA